MVGAVIYVRVSTKEQTENLSLPTQLRACEDYCRRQGYEVLERFHEEGESAKTTDRSQLQVLLKFCRTHKGKVHFLVVYNLTGFAREKYDHFALRAHLQSLGISLRSVTEPIDDTSTGKLMGSEIGRQMRDLAWQIQGPHGQLMGDDAPLRGVMQKYGLFTPSASIAGGTDEINKNIIGERVLGLPKEPDVSRDIPWRELKVGTQRG